MGRYSCLLGIPGFTSTWVNLVSWTQWLRPAHFSFLHPSHLPQTCLAGSKPGYNEDTVISHVPAAPASYCSGLAQQSSVCFSSQLTGSLQRAWVPESHRPESAAPLLPTCTKMQSGLLIKAFTAPNQRLKTTTCGLDCRSRSSCLTSTPILGDTLAL